MRLNNVLFGDCREVLKTLPDCSVQCCVTSPPYFNLRSYSVGDDHGELGQEKTPDEFVANLVAVFREVRRVLRDDGVAFLNLGDTFAANRSYQVADGKCKDVGNSARMKAEIFGVKPKDLIGIPWMTAFALRADGWYLRSDIIWAKGCSGDYKGGNVMPESVRDRPTRSHEYMFLLSKSERYFYDIEATKEPICDSSLARINQNTFDSQTGGDKDYGKTGTNTSRSMRKTLENFAENHEAGRNMRSVWTIKTKPYSGAHFAVFPEALIEPCIMAGTSEYGCCSACGAPYVRKTEKGLTAHDGETESRYEKGSTANRLALLRQAARERGEEYSNQTRTVGWEAACSCSADIVPCVVLDPFFGSGTTGQVAQRLGRNWIGIELNPAYAPLQQQRTAQGGLALC